MPDLAVARGLGGLAKLLSGFRRPDLLQGDDVGLEWTQGLTDSAHARRAMPGDPQRQSPYVESQDSKLHAYRH